MKPFLITLLLLVSVALQAYRLPVVWHRFGADTADVTTVSLVDTIPCCSGYTVIFVYRSDAPTVQHLWRLSLSDSVYVGNTTSGFYNEKKCALTVLCLK